MEKRSGERNADIGIQVQLEEDGGGSTRQSWMETSGLWTIFHWSDKAQVELEQNLLKLRRLKKTKISSEMILKLAAVTETDKIFYRYNALL